MNDSLLKKAKILIVDDKQENIDVLEGLLENLGYTNIKSTNDPRQVVGLFESFQPDLILLDLMMPYLNGFQVMEQLNLLIPKNTYLPVLVLTASSSDKDKKQALAKGAKDFVTKPFDFTEVALRIKNLLETRFLHMQLNNQNQILEQKVKERTAELEIAKEKAEESDRLKTAFINNMSHEIRTPLNGITGFISLLQDYDVSDEEKKEYFDIIKISSDRLIATVTDIMDISRIEAGEVKVTKSEVSVNEILEEQYKFFYHEAQSKGLKLIYKPTISDNESRIVTDKHKLEGILINLIKNAIKFTEQGKIEFGCHRKKEKGTEVLEFYVEDTGIGIPQNRIHAVFNRFEQADIEDPRVYEGSGLGLAIAKSYVEMLGGEIGVKSKESEGSTFTFTIPYAKPLEKKSDAQENLKKEPQTDLSHLSVLIAEDDEVGQTYLKTILQNKVKKLLFTTTGRETIDKCRGNPDIDLILMDIKMHDLNGYEATKRIREFNKDVIIIAQTAFALSGDREKAMDAGCNDYITKPFKKTELQKLIQKHFGE